MRLRFAVAALMSAALLSAALSPRASAAGERAALAVSTPPVPFAYRGGSSLAYELYIKAPCEGRMEISSVEILSGEGEPLAIFEGELLKNHLRPPDRAVPGYIAFLWLGFDEGERLPKSISHRVRYIEGGVEKLSEGAEVRIHGAKTVLIAPPLRGDGWVAVNGPSNDDRHHRMSVLSVNGAPFIGQRFAVDWMKLGPDGKIFTGKGGRNSDYPCYRQELLAVADGVVADARDGIPENRPLTVERAVPMTVSTLAGNYVVLKIGDKAYAFYAHLVPDSLRVKIGDRVKRGDVLGLLGNSGNSDAPHLHFHVCDGMDYLFSEGIPYALSSYALEGRAEGIEELFTKRRAWKPSGPSAEVKGELVADRDVISWQ
ncbi:MAG TPA: M23 family metallopeptidase [bacterium]|nr:M23 family metallopeptidase [bacterium]